MGLKLVLGRTYPDRVRKAVVLEEPGREAVMGYLTAAGERILRDTIGIRDGYNLTIKLGDPGEIPKLLSRRRGNV